MTAQPVPNAATRFAFRFHEVRDQLLAEAHARPSTPLPTPTLATRIATLSNDNGPERDRQHMAALCRKMGAPEPSPGGRWCALDAGSWRLRWERHTEVSTWTFYRPLADNAEPPLDETALDQAPLDWLAEIPGDILVASHIVLLRSRPRSSSVVNEEEIAADIDDGAVQAYTDFRPGADGFTRIHVIQPIADAPQAGRIVQRLFEIETYRLLALLAFPLAGEAARHLTRLEAEATRADEDVSKIGSIEADRTLLNHLACLAGEAQALSGRTSFRFSAARAYYGLVQERILQLRETRHEGRPTIADFMERRLAPAMRTCAAVAERLQNLIEHVATTSQLLNTRVDVAAEITNASLLASMNRRAKLQLRLQQTIEGLSVAAISYYALGLLEDVFKAASAVWKGFDPYFATGLAVPAVVGVVWWSLHRAWARLLAEHQEN